MYLIKLKELRDSEHSPVNLGEKCKAGSCVKFSHGCPKIDWGGLPLQVVQSKDLQPGLKSLSDSWYAGSRTELWKLVVLK